MASTNICIGKLLWLTPILSYQTITHDSKIFILVCATSEPDEEVFDYFTVKLNPSSKGRGAQTKYKMTIHNLTFSDHFHDP